MKIQVLGSGCSNCHKLFELTQKAVKQLGLKDEVEYITDVKKIIEMGVMSSPILAIDGKPAMVGIVPDLEKIKKMIINNSTVLESGCNQNEDCCGDDCECNSISKEKKSYTCEGKG